ncbi:sugar ABC transporter substrate-binding protein [Pengzhenrongella frigida]|uniref:Extracellular solute-binding protein n=1 Tax=Pengzhenrongella frigida TaxID=1259133 RepID=A0A4Q5N1S2_9MICO|nr:extracellular solute-binding protein [Cellulomonas sp. HLT2-17]RYV52078.1 extracellular solute-binding protein [Cellulomonas sp. HLT2-17]
MARMSTNPRRKKVAAIAAIGLSLTLALTACAGGSDAADADAAEAPKTTLTFWHYFTDRADLLQELATQYEDETGVEIKLELVPGDALPQKFQAAAQADQLPDISAGWTSAGEKLAPYALEGKILNLSTVDGAAEWFEEFAPSAIQGVTYTDDNQWDVDPGAYLVPLDTNNMQILYNKDLFEQAGITDLPTDLDEFIEVSQKLRDADIQPFVSGFSSWPLGSLASMYVDNVVPADVRTAAYDGSGRYDTPEWIEFLTVFEKLAEGGVFADGILGYDMPAAETLFASGQVGMIFDGSWALGVFNETSPDFKNYGVFMPPSVGDETLYIPGGVGSTIFVVGTSPNADASVAFLKWLTATDQQKKYAEASFNIPANRQVAEELELDENIAAFAAGADKLTPASPVAMQGAVVTTMTAGLQLIIAGSDTPAAVAARMQLAQETDLAQ